MIKQAAIGLNSRSEANPFNEDAFLPLITAPMSCVVDETNYQVFWENKINICFPRTTNLDKVHNDPCYKDSFHAISLEEFIESFVTNTRPIGSRPYKRCIDTANGNMVALHNAIKKAKEIHGDSLIIMAGNVASVEAFIELAKTGVDYIRVGIGGGGGCNTTSNTGVGQEDLEKLIKDCYDARHQAQLRVDYPRSTFIGNQKLQPEDCAKIVKVKIVADGISSYINYCQKEYGFNDNGYAAINKLLFAGADLVMIGKLFAQCLESAGEKKVCHIPYDCLRDLEEFNVDIGAEEGGNYINSWKEFWNHPSKGGNNILQEFELQTKYSGMSTQEEQLNYKPLSNIKTGFVQLKPSEGSVQWIPIKWTLNEWLNGSTNQDEYPYLMGWVNSIRSAMSYTGKKTLK